MIRYLLNLFDPAVYAGTMYPKVPFWKRLLLGRGA